MCSHTSLKPDMPYYWYVDTHAHAHTANACSSMLTHAALLDVWLWKGDQFPLLNKRRGEGVVFHDVLVDKLSPKQQERRERLLALPIYWWIRNPWYYARADCGLTTVTKHKGGWNRSTTILIMSSASWRHLCCKTILRSSFEVKDRNSDDTRLDHRLNDEWAFCSKSNHGGLSPLFRGERTCCRTPTLLNACLAWGLLFVDIILPFLTPPLKLWGEKRNRRFSRIVSTLPYNYPRFH